MNEFNLVRREGAVGWLNQRGLRDCCKGRAGAVVAQSVGE